MRRALFGLFWFGLFWIALLTICGGIAGSMAGGNVSRPGETFGQGFDHGFDAGVVAGAQFRERYGKAVLLAAAALAFIGTAKGILPGTQRSR